MVEICLPLPEKWSHWSVSSHVGPFVGILLLLNAITKWLWLPSQFCYSQEHDGSTSPSAHAHHQLPQVTYAYLKYEWYSAKKPGDDKKRIAAFNQLQVFFLSRCHSELILFALHFLIFCMFPIWLASYVCVRLAEAGSVSVTMVTL
jgi:hypothetical protein